MKKFTLVFLLLLICLQPQAQIFKDSLAPIESRVKDLISRMTAEEKFWQLFMLPGDLSIGKEKLKTGIFGFQISTVGQNADAAQQLMSYAAGASAVETAEMVNEMQAFFIRESRLGIPIIPFDEALHGLVRRGATAFPQSIGLAASWNTALMHRVSAAIAIESKTRGIRQILSPVINIATDVRWGRTEETYGEDPFLFPKWVWLMYLNLKRQELSPPLNIYWPMLAMAAATAIPFTGMKGCCAKYTCLLSKLVLNVAVHCL